MTSEGAPPGNNNAMLWKTPEERAAACDRLCEHLRKGLSLQCFVEADEDTVKRYMRDFPVDFGTDKVRAAMRESRMFWEAMGIDGTGGKIKGFQPASWKFNMQNRAGWKDNLQLGSDPENPLPKNEPTVIEVVHVHAKAKDDAPADS